MSKTADLESKKIKGLSVSGENEMSERIIYLNGDPKLNAGTGFYNFINEKTFDLNTAVGCFPNRAVLFNAEDWHSPLLYTAKDNLPRFSIIVWFEPENNL